jgi:endonuclease/exonuclease/phosphatase family metal-dependent hydrolase
MVHCRLLVGLKSNHPMLLRRTGLPLFALFLPFSLLLTTVSRQPQFRLKIVAFNTHLLPRIALGIAGRRGQGPYRAQAIGHRLASYDVLGLCEVFDGERRSELIGSLQQASGKAFNAVWYGRPRGRAFTNSGLLFLSRYPVESHHLITYRHASRFLTHGFRADAFAAKGAIHARIKLSDSPRQPIDCFLTHLDSRSASARAGQIDDLVRFIALHASPQRPAILMGDFNIAADFPLESPGATRGSLYQQLLAALTASGIDWIDVWPSLQSGPGGTSAATEEQGGRRIDYVFVSAGNASAACAMRPTRIAVERFYDPRVAEGSLSDHAAVECDFELVFRSSGGSGRGEDSSARTE